MFFALTGDREQDPASVSDLAERVLART
jgi:hypothetical protein